MDDHAKELDEKLSAFVAEAQSRTAELYRTQATAYDGFSKRPQDRELTPLERDIMCRILSDIFHAIRRGNHDNLWKVIRTINQRELDMLVQVREVITPRED